MTEIYIMLGMAWFSGLCIGAALGRWYTLNEWRKSLARKCERIK